MTPVLTQKSVPISVRWGLVECRVSSILVAGSSAWDSLNWSHLGRPEAEHMIPVSGVLYTSKGDPARTQ